MRYASAASPDQWSSPSQVFMRSIDPDNSPKGVPPVVADSRPALGSAALVASKTADSGMSADRIASPTAPEPRSA